MNKSILILFLFSLPLHGQVKSSKFRIQGTITDAVRKSVVPFANVFLEGTTISSQADSSGHFVLKNVLQGNYRLVVSAVGYISNIQNANILDKDILVNISLTEDTEYLNEVTVVAQKDKTWERNYRDFEKEFLGYSYNKSEVKIKNKEVLEFTNNEGILTAKASKPIIIENRTLGYKITYILQDFERKRETTSFKGLSQYELLAPVDSKEAILWSKNRIRAYKGSLTHFLKSLIDNDLTSQGFDAFFLNPNYSNTTGIKPLFYEIAGTRHFVVRPEEIIQKKPNAQETNLQWTYAMEVVYNKQSVTRPIYSDAPYPYSILIPKSQVSVTANGSLLNPYSIEMKGDMGKKGFAELLPLDYSLPKNQSGEVSPDEVITQSPAEFLENFTVQNQAQKVYLHTDKVDYYRGDTLWYKVYVVDATTNKLFQNEQKLYVEIYPEGSESTPIIRQILKTTENGIAWSNILLPDTLTTGNYRLKSYTNWMRNTEPSVIFQKNFTVRNLQNKVAIISVPTENKAEVKFYPEGGQYLWDKPTRMGIKIENHSGGIVKGKLLDYKGNIISDFSTDIFGIGSFMVKNEKKKPVKVSILNSEYALPKPQEEGFSMQIDHLKEDSIRINIFSSFKKSNESVRILMQSKGVVFDDIAMNLNQNSLSFAIPKHELPSGVYQITIFNEALLPQCERLIFIKAKESGEIIVSSDKDKRALNLQIKPINGITSGEFSLAIADAFQVNSANYAESIEAYLLLSSELKGKVDNPNYYFSDKTQEKISSLDNLMLTQGWRRYQWKDILQNTATTAKIFKQYEPIIIRGEVYSDDKVQVILPNVNVIILPMDSLQRPIFTETDKNGRFIVENLDFMDSLKCVVKIMNAKGKEIKAKIKFDNNALIFSTKNQNTNFKMPIRLDSANVENEEIIKYKRKLLADKSEMLEEVVVKYSKPIDYDYDSNGNRLPKLYGEPDGVIQVSETTFGANVIQIIQGRIPAIKISGDGNSQPYTYSGRGRGTFTNNTTTTRNPNTTVVTNTVGSSSPFGSSSGSSESSSSSVNSSNSDITDEPPLFLLDGVIVPTPREQGDFLMSIAPQEIERIDYLVNASASMYGVRASNGVIAIYTKKGPSKTKSNLKTSLLTLKLQGFQGFKEFYVSKNVEGIVSNGEVKDILLWKPSFQLKKGEIMPIDFNVNSFTKKILVVIQGLFNNGEPYSVVKIVSL